MLSRRLKCRVPSAEVVGVGYVVGHKLTFDKKSKDNSGKCDCEATRVTGDRVYGVIYEIEPEQKRNLDITEGLGHGYKEKLVSVIVDSRTISATTYYATNKVAGLQPYDWYKDFVIFGAREHHLPKTYVEFIDSVMSLRDSNKERTARERRVLAGEC